MNDLVKRLREGEDGLEYAAANEIEELEDRISALEAALRFYADPSKYTDIHGDDVQVPDFYSETDFGETARVVLAGGKDD